MHKLTERLTAFSNSTCGSVYDLSQQSSAMPWNPICFIFSLDGDSKGPGKHDQLRNQLSVLKGPVLLAYFAFYNFKTSHCLQKPKEVPFPLLHHFIETNENRLKRGAAKHCFMVFW